MAEYHFELFADYFQFYLQDENAAGDLSEAWTPEAIERMLALAPGTIGVGTARNMTVPVDIEILETRPAASGENLADCDLVNECSVDVPSGRLVVAGCTEYFPDAARIVVTPGTYEACIYYFGLDLLSDDGLEGNDRYRIVLWQGEAIPLRVVRSRGA